MIYNSVSEIFEVVDKTREKLKRRVLSLTEEEKNSRADEKGWSVAEIVEHLATVEMGVVKITAKLLQKAETEGVKSDGTFSPPVSFVEQAKAAQNRKLVAPERIQPQGKQSVTESLTRLDENRRQLNELRSRIEAVDSSRTAFPHPFFGDINLYQWLVMLGMHERRHLEQIEAILEDRRRGAEN